MTRPLLACLATLALATTADAQFSFNFGGPSGPGFRIGHPVPQDGNARRGRPMRTGTRTVQEEVQETYVVTVMGPDGRPRQEERTRTRQVPVVEEFNYHGRTPHQQPRQPQPRIETRTVTRVAYDHYGRAHEVTEEVQAPAPRQRHHQQPRW